MKFEADELFNLDELNITFFIQFFRILYFNHIFLINEISVRRRI